MTRLLLLVVFCLLLTACGSKGDLYLPEEPSVEPIEPSNLPSKKPEKVITPPSQPTKNSEEPTL